MSERVIDRLRPHFKGGSVPQFYKGSGCKECFGTGYSGRLGLYEIFRLSPSLRDLIGPGQPASVLKNAAIEEGFRTLSLDGIAKAAQGVTTVDEVFRVAPPETHEKTPQPAANPPKAEVGNSGDGGKPTFSTKLSPGIIKAMAKISSPAEPLAFADDEDREVAEDAPLVLVVDDNEIIRLTICDALESEDYSVLTAEDGQEACEIVAEEKPDLIVTDYIMPRMDGIALIKKTKADKSLRDIPIIMLTAKDDAESAVLVLKAGADDYLTKPVNRKLFLESVKRLLKR